MIDQRPERRLWEQSSGTGVVWGPHVVRGLHWAGAEPTCSSRCSGFNQARGTEPKEKEVQREVCLCFRATCGQVVDRSTVLA